MNYKEKEIIERLKNKNNFTNNLFSVLGIANKEMFHSRFLAFLLAPDGQVISGKDDTTSLDISHKYNTQFLKSFINICNLKIGNRNLDQTKVYIEYPFESDGIQSRIDILIQIGKYWIGIENKIYADDGDSQIERYYRLPESVEKGLSPKKYSLIYLTLDGRYASPKSQGNLENEYYKCISYLEDINIKLLNCCRTTDPSLKDFVSHYKNALSELLIDYELSRKIDGKWELIKNLLKNKDSLVKERTEQLLKDFIFPNIVFDLCNNQDDFYPENNTFYIWIPTKKNEKKIEYDLFFEFQTDLTVNFYPVKIDRTNSQKEKWYWGDNNGEKEWKSWGTKKNRKCWNKDKIITLEKFLEDFDEKYPVIEEMKKFIEDN